MLAKLQSIGYSAWFTNFITCVIIAAGVLIGIETYPAMVARYGGVLHTLDKIILWIFVAELVLKVIAEGGKPWRYFRDPWNVFDFVIVVACFMPGAGDYVVVLRMARLLRVLKLVRALPKLQMLVTALLKSIPSMFYVTILLGLLFYVYAVAAVFFFGPNDPLHFESLHLSMLSLFRVVTLEDWTDVMYIAMYGCDAYGYGGLEQLCVAPNAQPVLAAAFFSSFVLLGTMIILNLFVGVILSSMAETAAEYELAVEAERAVESGQAAPTMAHELVMMEQELAAMQGRIAVWHAMGQAVEPLRLGVVASNVFTDPEIATVGVTQAAVDEGRVSARAVTLPLGTNPRAKMQGVADGFVKVFCRPGSGTVLGAVVVGPRASELVLGLSVAVQHGLTVDQVAHTFSIYPSLSGSVTEASRQLMEVR